MNKQAYQEFMNYYNPIKDKLAEASDEVKAQFMVAMVTMINQRLVPIMSHLVHSGDRTFLNNHVFAGSTNIHQDEYFVTDEDKELLKIVQDCLRNCSLGLAFVDFLSEESGSNVIVKYSGVKVLQKERINVLFDVYTDRDMEEVKDFLVPLVYVDTGRIIIALND